MQTSKRLKLMLGTKTEGWEKGIGTSLVSGGVGAVVVLCLTGAAPALYKAAGAVMWRAVKPSNLVTKFFNDQDINVLD